MRTQARYPGPRLVLVICMLLAVLPLVSPAAPVAALRADPAPTIVLATGQLGNIFTLGQPVTATVTLALAAGSARQFFLAESLLDYAGAATSLITPTATAALTATIPNSVSTTTPITETATAAYTASAALTHTAAPSLSPTMTPGVTATPVITTEVTPTATLPLSATTTPISTIPVSTAVTLAPGRPWRTVLTLPVVRLGYYELTVSLAGASGAPVAASTISLGVLAARRAAPDPASPFGVIGGLTEAYGNRPADLVRAAGMMAQAGIAYTREEFNWQTIEPRPGRGYFDFRRQDIAIIAAHRAGLRVLGLIDYWGRLPQPDTTYTYSGTTKLLTVVGCSKAHACAYTANGVAWFARFAAALVNHYRPGGVLARAQHWNDGFGITDWEVWNEPSTLSFWRHDLRGYATLFAQMYSATTAAIHGGEPGARVMYDESGQAFDGSLRSGGAGHDVVALHIYTNGLDPDTALVAPVLPRGGLGQAPAAVGGFVAGRAPVWITETGYATDGSVTPAQQAAYLVRSYVDYLAAGVRRVFWFKFHQDAPTSDNLYSLVHANFSPKPAYVAYAAMSDLLAGASFSRAVSLGSQIHADLFSSGSGTTAVLWSSGAPATLETDLGSAPATVYDLQGNPIAQQSGPVTLHLTGDPIYLATPAMTPAALAVALARAQVGGIAPAGIDLRLAPGLVNNLPDIKAVVSAQTNAPISGTVTLGLPDGWRVDRPARPFSTLLPGQSTTLTFHLESEVSHVGDTIVATATTTLGQTAVMQAPVPSFTLTYGHPTIDGSLATWAGAAESDLIDLQPGQVVGIPGWTASDLSARIFTMWDERYFYLAALVHNAQFGPGYVGDWFQYGWGTDAAAWDADQGANRFNLTTALIPAAPGRRLPGLWSQWAGVKQALTTDPTSGDLAYTAAIPWSDLGGFVPAAGKQIAFDALLNQYVGQSRVGWIQFTPGIRLGFFPTLYPLWTLTAGTPAAGVRLGGQYAPLQSGITLPLAVPHGTLVIHDGGMSAITLRVNGHTVSLATGDPNTPLAPFGDTSLDLSPYLHAGSNTIGAVGAPARAGGAAALSFFQ